MKKALLLVGGILALALGLAYGIVAFLRAASDWGGFFTDAARVLDTVPASPWRTLIMLAALLPLVAFALTPLVLLERRSRRAYEREAARLRAERPDDAVTPYAGVEGEGLSFDGPTGRVLLLQGDRGVGEPTRLHVDAHPPP